MSESFSQGSFSHEEKDTTSMFKSTNFFPSSNKNQNEGTSKTNGTQQSNKAIRLVAQEKKLSQQEKEELLLVQLQLTSKQSSSQSSQSNQDELDRLAKYQKVKTIGRGAYGVVTLVKNQKGQLLAMKEISQKQLKRDNKQHQAYMEKLQCHFNHPGIPQFHCCFAVKQNEKLYFIMSYADGEQLSNLLKNHFNSLTTNIIKFFVAEMVLILQYIHSLGLSHRDFKPENIVLTKEGHIQLIDYGTLNDYCKQLLPQDALKNVQHKDRYRKEIITSQKKLEVFRKLQDEESLTHSEEEEQPKQQIKMKDITLKQEDEEDIEKRARCQTFCGTPEYLCPEMLDEQICEMSGDLWALGILMYKMFTDDTPFGGDSQIIIFQNIKSGNYNKQTDMIPKDAMDLINNLLIYDRHNRIGSVIVDEKTTKQDVQNAYQKLKSHPFFTGINWDTLYSQQPPEEIIQFLTYIRNQNNNNMEHEMDSDDDDQDINIQQMRQTVQPTKTTTFEKDEKQKNPFNFRSSEGNIQIPEVKNKKNRNKGVTLANDIQYLDVVSRFIEPFTLDNLFYQTKLNKVNKHLLLFSVKKPRQILLFDVEPITIIYYIPAKDDPNYKKIILDQQSNVQLEQKNRISIQDSIEKYIFEDKNSIQPTQLYDAIQRLQQKRSQQQQQQQQQSKQ